MHIILRWGKNREPQSFTLFGGGAVRALRVGGLRDHAAQLHDGDGEVRALLLRYVCRRSVPRRMGDGADPALVLSSQFRSAFESARMWSSILTCYCEPVDAATDSRILRVVYSAVSGLPWLKKSRQQSLESL